ncbi:hypothetical protein BDP55DRAFT_710112 [Colletotrichum godetiae]|uniref:Uncharacterized protein n=1 Tax=Colletotrichum godetiae TaxID=1209918 RepID=A0AAJ0F2A4_9PEZI|nr:uncharacterized protein BDP55DRAFT_710112 [Colletotrichum godetiae]KAK1700484.1 hypothetical protein BDP55DRAFT_710112 [Colletotrichum godetiae]
MSTDELEAAGLSSSENALFHPRMRSWWRAKAFVLIKSPKSTNDLSFRAKSTVDSFPRNERNRATGIATDVDPAVCRCCGQFHEIDAIFTPSAPAGDPVQGPDHGHPVRRIRSGVWACCRGIGHSGLSTGGGVKYAVSLTPADLGLVNSGIPHWLRRRKHFGGTSFQAPCTSHTSSVFLLRKPRLGRNLNDSLDYPQPVIPATSNSSLNLMTELLRTYSPTRTGTSGAQMIPPSGIHLAGLRGTEFAHFDMEISESHSGNPRGNGYEQLAYPNTSQAEVEQAQISLVNRKLDMNHGRTAGVFL